MQIGDRVQYKTAFLRSIGCYAGQMCHVKGKITGIKLVGKTLAIATIGWEGNHDEVPDRVITTNLQKVR